MPKTVIGGLCGTAIAVVVAGTLSSDTLAGIGSFLLGMNSAMVGMWMAKNLVPPAKCERE